MISTILECSNAYKWPKNQISNPFSSPPPHCNIPSNGYSICDPDKLLSPTQIEKLAELQKKITFLGNCPCTGPCKEGESGLVVGLLILEEYDNSNAPSSAANEINPDSLKEYSDYVRQQWNLGACDNSALITVITKTKQYGLSVGEKSSQILNDTWLPAILDEAFKNRLDFNLYAKLRDILFATNQAIEEEIAKNDLNSDGLPSSLIQSNSNKTFYILLILLIVLLISVAAIICFVFLRHRKENDDISIRDVWTKNFWTKAGTQYKAAKQSESGDKDIEKNEDDEAKAKLASTEDLKQVDDIEELGENIQKPKLSKV